MVVQAAESRPNRDEIMSAAPASTTSSADVKLEGKDVVELQAEVDRLRKEVNSQIVKKRLPRSHSVDLDDDDTNAHTQFRSAVKEVSGRDQGAGQLSVDSITARKYLKGHYGNVYSVHWSADNERVISASQDGTLIVWNGQTQNKISLIPLRCSWVMSCAFDQTTPKSTTVACGGLDNVCTIYVGDSDSDNPYANGPKAELVGHDGYVSCCRFATADKIITSSGDQSCAIWDITNERRVASFTGHTSDVMYTSINPTNSNVFASSSCDMQARVWDSRAPQYSTHEFWGHDGDVNCVEFFSDGNTIVTGSDDASLRLWDLRSGKEFATFASDQCMTGVTSLAVSHSGGLIFSGHDDYNCNVWSTLEPDKPPTPLIAKAYYSHHPHKSRLSCLGISPDGSALCSGSWDTNIIIWA